jgi:hypothetical protein
MTSVNIGQVAIVATYGPSALKLLAGPKQLKIKSNSPMCGVKVVTPGLISWSLMMVSTVTSSLSNVNWLIGQTYFLISPDLELTPVGNITNIPYKQYFNIYKQTLIMKKNMLPIQDVFRRFQHALFPDAIIDDENEVIDLDNPASDSLDEFNGMMHELDILDSTNSSRSLPAVSSTVHAATMAPVPAALHPMATSIPTVNSLSTPVSQNPPLVRTPLGAVLPAGTTPDAMSCHLMSSGSSATNPAIAPSVPAVNPSSTPISHNHPIACTPLGAVLPAGTAPDAMSCHIMSPGILEPQPDPPGDPEPVHGCGKGRGRKCGAGTGRTTRLQATVPVVVNATFDVDDELDEELANWVLRLPFYLASMYPIT